MKRVIKATFEATYYEPDLGIDGTASFLADTAERYTDDYSDAALQRIIEICKNEHKDLEAQEVSAVLESRHNIEQGEMNIGQMKLDLLNGYTTLVDEDSDNTTLTISDTPTTVTIAITDYDAAEDYTRANSTEISRDEFLNMSAAGLKHLVDGLFYYAQ